MKVRALVCLLFTIAFCTSIGLCQTRTHELTGTVAEEIESTSDTVQDVWVTVGDGGSGPYKAILAGERSLPTHTIYRPKDLTPFGAKNLLPLATFANGGCRNSSGEFRKFLTEIASHGYLVIAVGPAAKSVITGGEEQSLANRPELLLDPIDWATKENARPGSEYQGKLNTSKVAVMGMSCGGAVAIAASSDSRVSTTVLWNSSTTPDQSKVRSIPGIAVPKDVESRMPQVGNEALLKLHAPVAFFNGGKDDIAAVQAQQNFDFLQDVPVFYASRDFSVEVEKTKNPMYGHYPATYRESHGGVFAQAGVAWLDWQLKGVPSAAKMFTGAKCGLSEDPKWTVQRKNIR